MNNLSAFIPKAAAYAAEHHEGVERKYNGLPYIYHPMRVAGMVLVLQARLPYLCYNYNIHEIVAAAWMHDLIEDTKVTYGDIEREFNKNVADLVQELTNSSLGSTLNRARRKKIDRDALRQASFPAKIIKLLDRIDNLTEMDGADDGFAVVYAKESLLLANAIGDADYGLNKRLVGLANTLLAVRGG